MSLTTFRTNKFIYKESTFNKGQTFTGQVPVNHWGIKICTKGLEPYDLGNQIVNLGSNQLIVFDELNEYQMHSPSKDEVKGVCVDIPKNVINYNAINLIAQVQNVFPIDLPNSFTNIVSDPKLSVDFKSEEIVRKLLEINRLLNCIDSSLSDSFKNKSTVQFNTIAAHKIKTYLENNARDYFNLDDISRNIGLSKFKMLRLFKQSFGTTPLDYFHMQKISLAKIEIINSPNKSFSAISTELGYESLSTFTKTFKKYENLSPSQFKKTMQK